MKSTDCILVTTDLLADAELVRDNIADEFEQVVLSINPDDAISDFEKHRPAVIVLAFRALERSAQYYLNLYRHSETIHRHPHSAILLCTANDLKRAYELCRADHFDDYVQFWPLYNDPRRLLMTIHRGLRSLTPRSEASHHEEPATRGTALAALESVIQRESSQKVECVVDMSQAPKLLVVDDDVFQRKLLAQMLKNEGLDIVFAASGAQALTNLKKWRPDLILMDVNMPGANGLEISRRLKSDEQFASIPIIMITGQSEKDLVMESVRAGASDFLVKPFDKNMVMARIIKALGQPKGEQVHTDK